MLSDALAECIDRMDDYFQRFPEAYAGHGPRLHRLREEMDEVRALLDAPHAVMPCKDTRPAFIKWMEKNGLGRAKQSGNVWVVRSGDRTE